jgi:hypothetical protein
MERTKQEVMAQVELFMAALAVYCNDLSINKELYSFVFHAEVGSKNIRIVRRELWKGHEAPTEGGSVHCFIEKATGNIFKAESFKKPAPQIRGSIFNPNFDIGRAVTQYGAAYLR